MDCLNDAIYDLEEMRKKLDKKMDDKFQKKIKRIKK